jgi:hypothetical protein
MRCTWYSFFLLWLLPSQLPAQMPAGDAFVRLNLQDLSEFNPTSANWQIAGDARADLQKDEAFQAIAGKGVILNLPDAKNRGGLVSKLQHGDMDLELEFMMARHSNSGIYLQGRYEVQLLDSWGKNNPTFGDCGGIYERWDDARPEGKKGYEGYAPRVNAARAPGLWQHLRIAFQAPRFDAAGKKIANARILRLELNGVLLHENLELTGPTRGQAFPGEAALGALFFQGDHGPVAFRNIRYQLLDGAPARLEGLQYTVYQCEERNLPDLKTLKVLDGGASPLITHEITKLNEDFVIRFSGKFVAPREGLYHFDLAARGTCRLRIKDNDVVPLSWWDHSGDIRLPAGEWPFELVYFKPENWYPTGLALHVQGPGFRSVALNTGTSLSPAEPTRPIIVENGRETTILRSFLDFSTHDTLPTHRVIRAVHVGFPNNTSYSYNAGNGALLQAWRGGFLDATPMWDSRGDGSARANGARIRFADAPLLNTIPEKAVPIPDTLPANAAFRPLGYQLDDEQTPTFRYQAWGAELSDKMIAADQGKSLERQISIQGAPAANTYLVLAFGQKIEALPGNMYSIDGKYFLRLPRTDKVITRTDGGRQELLFPANAGLQFNYSIIW